MPAGGCSPVPVVGSWVCWSGTSGLVLGVGLFFFFFFFSAAFLLTLMFCNFLELMRCHIGIGCCKMGDLQADLTIGAL
jgi:hypothetical protein